MKIYYISSSLIVSFLFLIIACDKQYEPVTYDDYVPINTTFYAGSKDSCTYYDFEPDIVLSSYYLNSGYFEYSQAFDLDNDGIDDFALDIEGYRDSSKTDANYWRTIYLHSLNGYKTAIENENNYSGVGSLIDYDTLTHYGYIPYYDNNYKFQMIESGYNYEANSFDTCCGTWNKWGMERYVGFRKIDDQDTIFGWMRLEMRADTDLIILKDAAIQKFSEWHD